ncbi:MAG: peptidase C14, partial [Sphaerospermopsis kisseleviana]
ANSTLHPAGLRFRARPEPSTAKLALKELDLFNHLQTQNSVAKNVMVLKATSQPEQPAGELLFSGFSAGLFTYALTQYLWEVTPATTIQILLSHASGSMYKLGIEQRPGLLSEKKNPQSALINENFPIESNTAEGVVKAKDDDGKTVQLWLGGIPPHVW